MPSFFIKSSYAEPEISKGTLYVEVAAAKLRAEPKAWARSVGEVKYGDPILVEATEGDWVKGSFNNSLGYIHKSAVTVKKVELGASLPSTSGVASNDVVLAGKGLTDDVERTFASSNPHSDFETLEKIENSPQPTEAELVQFLRTGGLKGIE